MDALLNAYVVIVSLWQAGWYSTGVSQADWMLAGLATASRWTGR